MKYLKEYKIFESLLPKCSMIPIYDKINQEIEDILLPISDMGYNVTTRYVRMYADDIPHESKQIEIKLVNDDDNQLLNWNDEIADEIKRLESFIKDEGLKIYEVYYSIDLSSYRNKVVEYSLFMKKIKNGDKLKKLYFIIEGIMVDE